MTKNSYVDKLTNYLNANLEGTFVFHGTRLAYRVVNYMGPSQYPPSKSVEESIKAASRILPTASSDKLCTIQIGNLGIKDGSVDWTGDVRWVSMDKSQNDAVHKFTMDPFDAIDELPLG